MKGGTKPRPLRCFTCVVENTLWWSKEIPDDIEKAFAMSIEMIAWWKKSEWKKLVLYGLRGSHDAVMIWKKNEGIAKKTTLQLYPHILSDFMNSLICGIKWQGLYESKKQRDHSWHRVFGMLLSFLPSRDLLISRCKSHSVSSVSELIRTKFMRGISDENTGLFYWIIFTHRVHVSVCSARS